MIVGVVLGPRYRALRDDLAAFRRDAGRGDVAERLIKCAPDFEKAAAIFNDWRYSSRPRAPEHAFAAMIERLFAEGPTDATLHFLLSSDALEKRRSEYEDSDEYAYAWDVAQFEESVGGESAS